MGHLDGMQEGGKAAATEGEDSGGAAALLLARFSRGLGLGCLPPSELAQGSDRSHVLSRNAQSCGQAFNTGPLKTQVSFCDSTATD